MKRALSFTVLLLLFWTMPAAAQDPFAQLGEFLGMMGDGIINGVDEDCDDGNTDDGDGCSATGQIESGWGCIGEPSLCGGAITWVGPNGSGDPFICDGTGDNVPIQNAINACNATSGASGCRSVRLRAGLVCGITANTQINLKSGVVVEGAYGGTRPKIDFTGGGAGQGCFNTQYAVFGVNGTGRGTLTNSGVRNLELDLNRTTNECGGSGYYGIEFWNDTVTDFTLQDTWIHHGGADGVLTNNITDFHAWGNLIEINDHDGMQLLGCDRVRVHDNTLDTGLVISNVDLRIGDGCTDAKVYRNEGLPPETGGACWQIQDTDGDIELFENSCQASDGSYGIKAWNEGATTTIYVYNNTFNGGNIGADAIATVGYNAQIYNNTFHNWRSDCVSDDAVFANPGDTASILVKNNICTSSNNGIADRGTTPNQTFTSRYNRFFNTSPLYVEMILDQTGDVTGDPLYANAPSDLHLQSQYGRWNGSTFVLDGSTSPAIDAGDPADDFSREIEGNGDRINQGAYGNTTEASKSSAGGDITPNRTLRHPQRRVDSARPLGGPRSSRGGHRTTTSGSPRTRSSAAASNARSLSATVQRRQSSSSLRTRTG
jgi:cysteine-rich repeat protein